MRQMTLGRSRNGVGSTSPVSQAGLGSRVISGVCATPGRTVAAPSAAALSAPTHSLSTASNAGRHSAWDGAVLPSSSGRQASCPTSAALHIGGCAGAHTASRWPAVSACASIGISSRARCNSGNSSSSSSSSATAQRRRGLGRSAQRGFTASPILQTQSRTAGGCPSPVAAASAASASSSAATSSASDRDDMAVDFVVEGSGLSVTMRKVSTLDELRQVATLRADAYYAENFSRFVGSLKKKFVEQEVESLQQRTYATSKQGTPFCECLVAVEAGSSTVLGCIDLRLPAALNGAHPAGVPAGDTAGCYLLNVVVREDVRGQGLGRAIMRAAMGRAVHTWGAARLYTHVEADNEVAYNLYAGCGFAKHSTDVRYEAETKLGQTVLLLADAELVGGGGGAAAAACA